MNHISSFTTLDVGDDEVANTEDRALTDLSMPHATNHDSRLQGQTPDSGLASATSQSVASSDPDNSISVSHDNTGLGNSGTLLGSGPRSLSLEPGTGGQPVSGIGTPPNRPEDLEVRGQIENGLDRGRLNVNPHIEFQLVHVDQEQGDTTDDINVHHNEDFNVNDLHHHHHHRRRRHRRHRHVQHDTDIDIAETRRMLRHFRRCRTC